MRKGGEQERQNDRKKDMEREDEFEYIGVLV